MKFLKIGSISKSTKVDFNFQSNNHTKRAIEKRVNFQDEVTAKYF